MEQQPGHGVHDAHAGHGSTQAGGLAVSDQGYTLDLDAVVFPSGTQTINFRLIGPDRQVVTAFTPAHDKDLHFIAVRRDLSGFQHVHPVMDAAGTWRIDLDLMPGDWRFFTDVHPSGHPAPLTLGIDAAVAGPYEPRPLPGIARSAETGPYTVTLDGDLVPGGAGRLTLNISENGEPVTDLDPYLAAYGHLVALRESDLGYLHVHPEGTPGDGHTAAGPDIVFQAVAPSRGRYRLFLDFQHRGVVRTAGFTVRADEPAHRPSDGPRSQPALGGQHHPEAPHHVTPKEGPLHAAQDHHPHQQPAHTPDDPTHP